MDPSLAGYFRGQAEWRDIKAEQYPEDARNAQSAAALRDLAEFVDHEDQRDAVDALAPHMHGMGLGGERAHRAVSRYGYGYDVTVGQHIEQLAELVALCLEDAYAAVVGRRDAEEQVLDPTGTLLGFEIDAASDGVVLASGYFRRSAQRRTSESELETWIDEARAKQSYRV